MTGPIYISPLRCDVQYRIIIIFDCIGSLCGLLAIWCNIIPRWWSFTNAGGCRHFDLWTYGRSMTKRICHHLIQSYNVSCELYYRSLNGICAMWLTIHWIIHVDTVAWAAAYVPYSYDLCLSSCVVSGVYVFLVSSSFMRPANERRRY